MKKYILLPAMLWLIFAQLCVGQIYYKKSTTGVSVPAQAVLLSYTTIKPDTLISDKSCEVNEPHAARMHCIYQYLDRGPYHC
jgi:hypothetical protein